MPAEQKVDTMVEMMAASWDEDLLGEMAVWSVGEMDTLLVALKAYKLAAMWV